MHEQRDVFHEVTCERGSHRWIATMAHELRQPLGAIVAAVELMKRGVRPSQRRRARLVLERQLRQLTRLVEDLVDATLIREGKAHLRYDGVDLRAIVRDVIDDVEAALLSKHQTIQFAAPHAEAWVRVDIQRIQQVVVTSWRMPPSSPPRDRALPSWSGAREPTCDWWCRITAGALRRRYCRISSTCSDKQRMGKRVDSALACQWSVASSNAMAVPSTRTAPARVSGARFTVRLPALTSNRGAA